MKETVGKKSLELAQKEPESRDPVEIQRSMLRDFLKHLEETINEGARIYPGDFFVLIITKRERLMQNVFRNYFFHRSSCPTPDYDQTVYRYIKKDNAVEYLWTIPDRETALMLKENALSVVESEKQLLYFVLAFADGDLFKLAKKLNGELDDSPLLS